MSVHAPDCGCETLGCKLRRKGIQVPPSALPTRTGRRPWRPGPKNSWEAGRIGEHRPDGSFMPVINAAGKELSTKEMADDRHRIERRLREVRQGINL